MIDKGNINEQRKKSLAWSFFKKLNQVHARCNLCERIFTYDRTTSNLIKHVRNKHSEAYLQVKQDQEPEELTSSIPHIDQTSTSWQAADVHLLTDESQNVESSAGSEQSSFVWNLFTRTDDMLAECNLCQIKLPYDDSIADLVAHREQKHSDVLLNSPQKEPSTNGLCDKSVGENAFLTQHSFKDSELNDEPAENTSIPKVDMKLKKSPAWQYFILIDKTYSQCKFCRSRLSHLNISNLMRHVIKKHPLELLKACKEKEKNVLSSHDTEEDQDDSTMESHNPATISDVDEESEEEDSIKKNASNTLSDNETSNLRRSKRIKTEIPLREEESPINAKTEDVSSSYHLSSPPEQNAVSEENSMCVEKRGYSYPNKGMGKKVGSCSSVWQKFEKMQNGCFRCKTCGNALAKSSSISNLWRHVRRVHPCASQKKSALRAPPPTTGPLQEVSSERLVRAVEEGNRLLRSLQSAAERQAAALERLAACLEGTQRLLPQKD